MTNDNIKEWLSEVEQAAKDYQEDCIDTIVTDINWELMSKDYQFEEYHISDQINNVLIKTLHRKYYAWNLHHRRLSSHILLQYIPNTFVHLFS